MKHTDLGLDPNEQAAHRYRLFSRAIRIAGLEQIATLQPYLQATLNSTLSHMVEIDMSNQG